MLQIGLIREEKTPPDMRVAFSPSRCADICQRFPDIRLFAAPSASRCFTDQEYRDNGVAIQEDLSHCAVLFGVKEVPVHRLMPGKTYFFFSHTKKKQPYNQRLMQEMIARKITLIDYECLTYEDGQRILGFGFYAGVVGAHNGLLTYGRKWQLYDLPKAHQCRDYQEMAESYLNIALPPVKIAVTGSGRVASGIFDLMHRFNISEVSPEDFCTHTYTHPVFTRLHGGQLYARKQDGGYDRDEFHHAPERYDCLFAKYIPHTDILMNGIYWDARIPRLFEREAIAAADFKMSVIADITCDVNGSVPINIAASSIADPVYGIDRTTAQRTAPFQANAHVIDVMAVDNLPNELPRDASAFFGGHLEKYVLPELLKDQSDILDRATICRNGLLTPQFAYLSDYAYGAENVKKLTV
jgi:alanine dehydrogenase